MAVHIHAGDIEDVHPQVERGQTVAAGTVRCCITPGRSQNLMSTYSTLSSEMYFRTSSELLNTH
jgi:hypothetical protein